MKKLKHFGLATIAAIGLLVTAWPVAGQGMRLGQDVVPTFQSIRLKIDADQKDYSGSVRIDLEVRKVATTFAFHAEGSKMDCHSSSGTHQANSR